MRCCHTTACGNDGKTKLISAGQSGAIETIYRTEVSAYEILGGRRGSSYETKSLN
jgi:hypothetical protein